MEELSETKEGEAKEEAKEEAGEQILPDGCERLAGLCTVTHPNGDISIMVTTEVLFMVKVLQFSREDQGMRPAAEQRQLEDGWVKALCAKAGRVVKPSGATSAAEPAQASEPDLDPTVGESRGEECDEIKSLRARVDAAEKRTALMARSAAQNKDDAASFHQLMLLQGMLPHDQELLSKGVFPSEGATSAAARQIEILTARLQTGVNLLGTAKQKLQASEQGIGAYIAGHTPREEAERKVEAESELRIARANQQQTSDNNMQMSGQGVSYLQAKGMKMIGEREYLRMHLGDRMLLRMGAHGCEEHDSPTRGRLGLGNPADRQRRWVIVETLEQTAALIELSGLRRLDEHVDQAAQLPAALQTLGPHLNAAGNAVHKRATWNKLNGGIPQGGTTLTTGGIGMPITITTSRKVAAPECLGWKAVATGKVNVVTWIVAACAVMRDELDNLEALLAAESLNPEEDIQVVVAKQEIMEMERLSVIISQDLSPYEWAPIVQEYFQYMCDINVWVYSNVPNPWALQMGWFMRVQELMMLQRLNVTLMRKDPKAMNAARNNRMLKRKTTPTTTTQTRNTQAQLLAAAKASTQAAVRPNTVRQTPPAVKPVKVAKPRCAYTGKDLFDGLGECWAKSQLRLLTAKERGGALQNGCPFATYKEIDNNQLTCKPRNAQMSESPARVAAMKKLFDYYQDGNGWRKRLETVRASTEGKRRAALPGDKCGAATAPATQQQRAAQAQRARLAESSGRAEERRQLLARERARQSIQRQLRGPTVKVAAQSMGPPGQSAAERRRAIIQGSASAEKAPEDELCGGTEGDESSSPPPSSVNSTSGQPVTAPPNAGTAQVSMSDAMRLMGTAQQGQEGAPTAGAGSGSGDAAQAPASVVRPPCSALDAWATLAEGLCRRFLLTWLRGCIARRCDPVLLTMVESGNVGEFVQDLHNVGTTRTWHSRGSVQVEKWMIVWNEPAARLEASVLMVELAQQSFDALQGGRVSSYALQGQQDLVRGQLVFIAHVRGPQDLYNGRRARVLAGPSPRTGNKHVLSMDNGRGQNGIRFTLGEDWEFNFGTDHTAAEYSRGWTANVILLPRRNLTLIPHQGAGIMGRRCSATPACLFVCSVMNVSGADLRMAGGVDKFGGGKHARLPTAELAVLQRYHERDVCTTVEWDAQKGRPLLLPVGQNRRQPLMMVREGEIGSSAVQGASTRTHRRRQASLSSLDARQGPCDVDVQRWFQLMTRLVWLSRTGAEDGGQALPTLRRNNQPRLRESRAMSMSQQAARVEALLLSTLRAGGYNLVGHRAAMATISEYLGGENNQLLHRGFMPRVRAHDGTRRVAEDWRAWAPPGDDEASQAAAGGWREAFRRAFAALRPMDDWMALTILRRVSAVAEEYRLRRKERRSTRRAFGQQWRLGQDMLNLVEEFLGRDGCGPMHLGRRYLSTAARFASPERDSQSYSRAATPTCKPVCWAPHEAHQDYPIRAWRQTLADGEPAVVVGEGDRVLVPDRPGAANLAYTEGTVLELPLPEGRELITLRTQDVFGHAGHWGPPRFPVHFDMMVAVSVSHFSVTHPEMTRGDGSPMLEGDGVLVQRASLIVQTPEYEGYLPPGSLGQNKLMHAWAMDVEAGATAYMKPLHRALGEASLNEAARTAAIINQRFNRELIARAELGMQDVEGVLGEYITAAELTVVEPLVFHSGTQLWEEINERMMHLLAEDRSNGRKSVRSIAMSGHVMTLMARQCGAHLEYNNPGPVEKWAKVNFGERSRQVMVELMDLLPEGAHGTWPGTRARSDVETRLGVEALQHCVSGPAFYVISSPELREEVRVCRLALHAAEVEADRYEFVVLQGFMAIGGRINATSPFMVLPECPMDTHNGGGLSLSEQRTAYYMRQEFREQMEHYRSQPFGTDWCWDGNTVRRVPPLQEQRRREVMALMGAPPPADKQTAVEVYSSEWVEINDHLCARSVVRERHFLWESRALPRRPGSFTAQNGLIALTALQVQTGAGRALKRNGSGEPKRGTMGPSADGLYRVASDWTPSRAARLSRFNRPGVTIRQTWEATKSELLHKRGMTIVGTVGEGPNPGFVETDGTYWEDLTEALEYYKSPAEKVENLRLQMVYVLDAMDSDVNSAPCAAVSALSGAAEQVSRELHLSPVEREQERQHTEARQVWSLHMQGTLHAILMRPSVALPVAGALHETANCSQCIPALGVQAQTHAARPRESLTGGYVPPAHPKVNLLAKLLACGNSRAMVPRRHSKLQQWMNLMGLVRVLAAAKAKRAGRWSFRGARLKVKRARTEVLGATREWSSEDEAQPRVKRAREQESVRQGYRELLADGTPAPSAPTTMRVAGVPAVTKQKAVDASGIMEDVIEGAPGHLSESLSEVFAETADMASSKANSLLTPTEAIAAVQTAQWGGPATPTVNEEAVDGVRQSQFEELALVWAKDVGVNVISISSALNLMGDEQYRQLLDGDDNGWEGLPHGGALRNAVSTARRLGEAGEGFTLRLGHRILRGSPSLSAPNARHFAQLVSRVLADIAARRREEHPGLRAPVLSVKVFVWDAAGKATLGHRITLACDGNGWVAVDFMKQQQHKHWKQMQRCYDYLRTAAACSEVTFVGLGGDATLGVQNSMGCERTGKLCSDLYVLTSVLVGMVGVAQLGVTLRLFIGADLEGFVDAARTVVSSLFNMLELQGLTVAQHCEESCSDELERLERRSRWNHLCLVSRYEMGTMPLSPCPLAVTLEWGQLWQEDWVKQLRRWKLVIAQHTANAGRQQRRVRRLEEAQEVMGERGMESLEIGQLCQADEINATSVKDAPVLEAMLATDLRLRAAAGQQAQAATGAQLLAFEALREGSDLRPRLLRSGDLYLRRCVKPQPVASLGPSASKVASEALVGGQHQATSISAVAEMLQRMSAGTAGLNSSGVADCGPDTECGMCEEPYQNRSSKGEPDPEAHAVRLLLPYTGQPGTSHWKCRAQMVPLNPPLAGAHQSTDRPCQVCKLVSSNPMVTSPDCCWNSEHCHGESQEDMSNAVALPHEMCQGCSNVVDLLGHRRMRARDCMMCATGVSLRCELPKKEPPAPLLVVGTPKGMLTPSYRGFQCPVKRNTADVAMWLATRVVENVTYSGETPPHRTSYVTVKYLKTGELCVWESMGLSVEAIRKDTGKMVVHCERTLLSELPRELSISGCEQGGGQGSLWGHDEHGMEIVESAADGGEVQREVLDDALATGLATTASVAKLSWGCGGVISLDRFLVDHKVMVDDGVEMKSPSAETAAPGSADDWTNVVIEEDDAQPDKISVPPKVATQAKRTCGHTECASGRSATLRCGQCRQVHYCSADCQQRAWRAHRAGCQRTKSSSASKLNHSAPSATQGDETPPKVQVSAGRHWRSFATPAEQEEDASVQLSAREKSTPTLGAVEEGEPVSPIPKQGEVAEPDSWTKQHMLTRQAKFEPLSPDDTKQARTTKIHAPLIVGVLEVGAGCGSTFAATQQANRQESGRVRLRCVSASDTCDVARRVLAEVLPAEAELHAHCRGQDPRALVVSKVDLCTGHVPCQPYSKMNMSRTGSADSRTVDCVMAMISNGLASQSLLVMVENVPAWEGSRLLQYMTEAFEFNGYKRLVQHENDVREGGCQDSERVWVYFVHAALAKAGGAGRLEALLKSHEAAEEVTAAEILEKKGCSLPLGKQYEVRLHTELELMRLAENESPAKEVGTVWEQRDGKRVQVGRIFDSKGAVPRTKRASTTVEAPGCMWHNEAAVQLTPLGLWHVFGHDSELYDTIVRIGGERLVMQLVGNTSPQRVELKALCSCLKLLEEEHELVATHQLTKGEGMSHQKAMRFLSSLDSTAIRSTGDRLVEGGQRHHPLGVLEVRRSPTGEAIVMRNTVTLFSLCALTPEVSAVLECPAVASVMLVVPMRWVELAESMHPQCKVMSVQEWHRIVQTGHQEQCEVRTDVLIVRLGPSHAAECLEVARTLMLAKGTYPVVHFTARAPLRGSRITETSKCDSKQLCAALESRYLTSLNQAPGALAHNSAMHLPSDFHLAAVSRESKREMLHLPQYAGAGMAVVQAMASPSAFADQATVQLRDRQPLGCLGGPTGRKPVTVARTRSGERVYYAHATVPPPSAGSQARVLLVDERLQRVIPNGGSYGAGGNVVGRAMLNSELLNAGGCANAGAFLDRLAGRVGAHELEPLLQDYHAQCEHTSALCHRLICINYHVFPALEQAMRSASMAVATPARGRAAGACEKESQTVLELTELQVGLSEPGDSALLREELVVEVERAGVMQRFIIPAMTLLKPERPDPLMKSAGACLGSVRFDESRNEVLLLDVVRVPTALDVGVSLLEEESGRPYPDGFNALNTGYVSALFAQNKEIVRRFGSATPSLEGVQERLALEVRAKATIVRCMCAFKLRGWMCTEYFVHRDMQRRRAGFMKKHGYDGFAARFKVASMLFLATSYDFGLGNEIRVMRNPYFGRIAHQVRAALGHAFRGCADVPSVVETNGPSMRQRPAQEALAQQIENGAIACVDYKPHVVAPLHAISKVPNMPCTAQTGRPAAEGGEVFTTKGSAKDGDEKTSGEARAKQLRMEELYRRALELHNDRILSHARKRKEGAALTALMEAEWRAEHSALVLGKVRLIYDMTKAGVNLCTEDMSMVIVTGIEMVNLVPASALVFLEDQTKGFCGSPVAPHYSKLLGVDVDDETLMLVAMIKLRRAGVLEGWGQAQVLQRETMELQKVRERRAKGEMKYHCFVTAPMGGKQSTRQFDKDMKEAKHVRNQYGAFRAVRVQENSPDYRGADLPPTAVQTLDEGMRLVENVCYGRTMVLPDGWVALEEVDHSSAHIVNVRSFIRRMVNMGTEEHWRFNKRQAEAVLHEVVAGCHELLEGYTQHCAATAMGAEAEAGQFNELYEALATATAVAPQARNDPQLESSAMPHAFVKRFASARGADGRMRVSPINVPYVPLDPYVSRTGVDGHSASDAHDYVDDARVCAGSQGMTPARRQLAARHTQIALKRVFALGGYPVNAAKSTVPDVSMQATGQMLRTEGTLSGMPECTNVPRKLVIGGRKLEMALLSAAGIMLSELCAKHLPEGTTVSDALKIAHPGSPLRRELVEHGPVVMTREALAKLIGYFRWLCDACMGVAPLLAAAWKCLYGGAFDHDNDGFEERMQEEGAWWGARAESEDDAGDDGEGAAWGGDTRHHQLDLQEEVELSERAVSQLVLVNWMLSALRRVAGVSREPAIMSYGASDAAEHCCSGFAAAPMDISDRKKMRDRFRKEGVKMSTFNLLFSQEAGATLHSGTKELVGAATALKLLVEMAAAKGLGESAPLEQRIRFWQEAVAAGMADDGDADFEKERWEKLLQRARRLHIEWYVDSASTTGACLNLYSKSKQFDDLLFEMVINCLLFGITLRIKWCRGTHHIEMGTDGASRGYQATLQRVSRTMEQMPAVKMGFGPAWRAHPSIEWFASTLVSGLHFVRDLSELDARLAGTAFAVTAHPTCAAAVFKMAYEVYLENETKTTVVFITANDRSVRGWKAVVRNCGEPGSGTHYHVKQGDPTNPFPMVVAVRWPIPPPTHAGPEVVRHCTKAAGAEAEHTTGDRLLMSIRNTRDQLQGARESNLLPTNDPIYTVPLTKTAERRMDQLKAVRRMMEVMCVRVDRRLALERKRQSDFPNAGDIKGGELEQLMAEARMPTQPSLTQAIPSGKRAVTYKQARKLKCVSCRTVSRESDLLVCEGCDGGVDTRHFGLGPACCHAICPKCLPKEIKPGAHLHWNGGQPKAPTAYHATQFPVVMCPDCINFTIVGRTLDPRKAHDQELRQMYHEVLLEMLEGRSAGTIKSYAWGNTLIESCCQTLPLLRAHHTTVVTSQDREDLAEGTSAGLMVLLLEHRRGAGYSVVSKVISAENRRRMIAGKEPLGSNRFAEAFLDGFRKRTGALANQTRALRIGELQALLADWEGRLKVAEHAEATHTPSGGHRKPAYEKLEGLVLTPTLCSSVLAHFSVAYHGFMRASEYQLLDRERVTLGLRGPEATAAEMDAPMQEQVAKAAGQETGYPTTSVSLTLHGPTKSSADAPATLALVGTTASGVTIFNYVRDHALHLDANKVPGSEWIVNDKGKLLTTAMLLRKVLRPSLRAIRASGRCPLLADVDIDKITLNSLRRGGNTHAADRGVERWQRCGHGRWSAGKDGRGSSVAMVDLYDQISLGRRLLVTARM